MVTFLVGCAVAVGIAGTLLPLVPGLGLIWLAVLAYGLIEGFGVNGWLAMTVITAWLAFGAIAGVRVPQRAAAAGGIGWRGQLLAFGLAALGFFLIPVVGAPLGFVGGVYLIARRGADPGRAWATTRRTLRALVTAAAVQFGSAIGMAATWLVWVATG